MSASTATADTPLRKLDRGFAAAGWVGSPLVTSTYCFKYALVSRAPHARLAWRLGGFVVNRHE